MSEPEIIVVGSGVSGLSCAIEVAQSGRRVQIWTRDLPLHTTSRIAAAFWYPYRAEPPERVVPWAVESYERFGALALNAVQGPRSGVTMTEAVEYFPAPAPDPAWARHVDHFRQLWPEELPPGYAHGVAFTAPVIEMPRYLPWLVEQTQSAGIEILERPLDALGPALEVADIVINCAGLGARELVPDPKLIPVRGQILRHKRGELDQVVVDKSGDQVTYVVPRSEDVILGGVADEGDESLTVRPAQSEDILARCSHIEPRVRDTEAIEVLVGVRPCRELVRLEAETVGDKLLVHNYGHGGAGVTLSWGCAVEVAELVRQHLRRR